VYKKDLPVRAKDLLCEYYYNPSDDELGKMNFDDTRRPRLTLSHLQKLRKMRDTEKVEKAEHLEFLPDMYYLATPTEESPLA